MRFSLLLMLISFGCVLTGQNRVFEIAQPSPAKNRDKLPFDIIGVNDLRGGDGSVGTVLMGLDYNQYRAVLIPDFEQSLHQVCGPTAGAYESEAQRAELNMLVFQLNEHTQLLEVRRRIEMAATLTVHTSNGPKYYGPVQFSENKLTLDGNIGHRRAITNVLEYITDQLALAYAAGEEIPGPVPAYNLLPEYPSSGAYRSLFDFRLGVIDSTVELLEVWKGEIIAEEALPRLHKATFWPTAGIRYKELKQLFGYRAGGRDYQYVRGDFYEITRMDDGRIVSMLPRNLFAVVRNRASWGNSRRSRGTIGIQADPKELIPYQFDLITGKFRQADIANNLFADVDKRSPIYLFYQAAEDSEPLRVSVNNITHTLQPNDHLTFNEAVEVSFSTGDRKARQKSLHPDIINNLPQVYTVRTDKNDQTFFTWEAEDAAEQLSQQLEAKK